MDECQCPKGFIIDGYPRNQDNFDGWQRKLADKTKTCFVLYLYCNEEVSFIFAVGE